tara:strand:+ start:150 stop:314 length:165 start_codon:yes stop_codon:yes gene_type:complete
MKRIGLIGGGVEGIIAECAEIELLLCSDDPNKPYFPTTWPPATAAVDLALTSQS